jgi:hypothetical protein
VKVKPRRATGNSFYGGYKAERWLYAAIWQGKLAPARSNPANAKAFGFYPSSSQMC